MIRIINEEHYCTQNAFQLACKQYINMCHDHSALFFPSHTNTFIEHIIMVKLFNAFVKEKDSINMPVNYFACCREINKSCGKHKYSKLRSADIEEQCAQPSLASSQIHRVCWSRHTKKKIVRRRNNSNLLSKVVSDNVAVLKIS